MSERFEQTVKHQMGVLSEDFQHKLDIVVEGHQMLSEKIDRVEANLSRQIESVATELSSHRADTEAHHGVYRVKEGE
jgi:cytochrome c556